MSGPFLHSGLDKWAVEAPTKPALLECKNGHVDVRYTYEQLLLSVQKLESHLLSLGVQKNSESMVLVWATPTESILAFHAVCKTGNAYIPCDVKTPMARVASIVQQARPSIVLVSESLLHHQETFKESTFVSIPSVLSKELQNVQSTPPNNNELTPDNTAFVVFTSGTTGVPKGSALTHRNYLTRTNWLRDNFHASHSSDQVLCLNSSTNFIDAACEIYGALGIGASLLVLTPEQVRDPIILCDALRAANVSSILCVPTLLRMMLLGTANKGGLGKYLPQLQTWFLSGEALPIDLLASLFEQYPTATAINVWGSSEACDSAAAILTQQDVQTYKSKGLLLAPIGKLIKSCTILILDAEHKVVPDGQIGEIWVFGDCVGRGYVNNPEATAERFFTFDASTFNVTWNFGM